MDKFLMYELEITYLIQVRRIEFDKREIFTNLLSNESLFHVSKFNDIVCKLDFFNTGGVLT